MEMKENPGLTTTSNNDCTTSDSTECVETELESVVTFSISTWCASVRLWSPIFCVVTSSLLSLLAGATLAYSSPTLLELTHLDDKEFRFNTILSEIFGAISLVGSIFGGPVGGYLADRYGRKTSLAFNILPYLLGYFIILMTTLIRVAVTFKVVIIIGRFFTGVGVGWSFTLVPIFICEITPAKVRGLYITISELILTLGILLMYGLGSIQDFHYYDISVVIIAIMAIFMLLFVWVPETPRWLILKLKDKKRAIAVLKYLRGPWNQRSIMKELNGIESIITARKLGIRNILSMIFCERDTLVPFLVAFFIAVFHQLCGVGFVTAYSAQLFLIAGATNPDLISFYVVGFGFLLSAMLTGVLVEVVGRKILLAISTAGMFVSLMMLGLQFHLTRPSLCANLNSSNTSEIEFEVSEQMERCNLHLYPMAIASILLYCLSFETGVGSITWILISEYLPLQVRGVASGITTSANRITGAIINGTFLSYSEWAGYSVSLWTLSFFNLVGFVVIIFCVVETRGKKLEEIPELFKTKFKMCHLCR